MKGKIVSINISDEKKKPKKPISSGKLIENVGLEGDAYNKSGPRQISITSMELLKEQTQCPRVGKGEDFIVGPGNFSETLTVEGMDLSAINIGDVFTAGETKFRISMKGMECWEHCPWNKEKGECPLPKHFLFAEVIKSGEIKAGDGISS
ncbi:MAG TPA: hypothetical protein PLK90_00235 [Clostridiales bacterium]|nr:hypothetical protein [Clostridiales bacterium]HQP68805.1 hypothetical protein [Clostridiales bacterium]